MAERVFTRVEIFKNVAILNFELPNGHPISVTLSTENARQMVRDVNSALTTTGKPTLPPGEPDTTNRFHTPLAVLAEGVTMPGIEGPTRILLTLEDGSQLAIPATQETIDALYRSLRSMTTAP
jgi:hypothetical protein